MRLICRSFWVLSTLFHYFFGIYQVKSLLRKYSKQPKKSVGKNLGVVSFFETCVFWFRWGKFFFRVVVGCVKISWGEMFVAALCHLFVFLVVVVVVVEFVYCFVFVVCLSGLY